MKLLSVAVVAALTVTGFSQEPRTGLSSGKKKAPVKVAGYVTDSEAKAVFARAEKMLRKITKSNAQVKAVPMDGGTVSRAEVVMQLDRLYEIVRPKFKITPRPVPVNATVLKMSGAAKTKLTRLVKAGAIGNYGPLAAGPLDKLTVQEFGDALGFFISRMAQMTHMPSPKWSPPLMDGS